jgi:hypothetical protein
MIMLLALPVLAFVALSHRCLQLYAPSNLLIRRVRASCPRLGAFAGLIVLAGTLLVAMATTSRALSAGAPGWLNVVVLVLAWDAIKVATLVVQVALRGVGRWVRELDRWPLRLVVSRSARGRSRRQEPNCRSSMLEGDRRLRQVPSGAQI